MDTEYQYFHTFMKKSNINYGNGLLMLMVQLATHVTELAENMLLKDHDMDNLKRKCAFVLSAVVGLCMEFDDINPYGLVALAYEIDPAKRTAFLLEKMNKLNAKVIKARFFGITNAAREIEQLSQELIHMLQDIALVTSVHDLMRLRIECHVHPNIESDKQHAISTKPHVKRFYERYPILPLKMRWNPRSTKLLEYLGKCMPLDMGLEMTTEHMVKLVTTRIMHRIQEHHEHRITIHNELGSLFQFASGDFSLDDDRSLQWPLLLHTETRPFEVVWKLSYPLLTIPEIEPNKRKGCQCPIHQAKRARLAKESNHGTVQNGQSETGDKNPSNQPSEQG